MTKGSNASYVLENNRMVLVSNSQIAPKIAQDTTPLSQSDTIQDKDHTEPEQPDNLLPSSKCNYDTQSDHDMTTQQSADAPVENVATDRPRRIIKAPDRLSYS